jgi:hypothetical protein
MQQLPEVESMLRPSIWMISISEALSNLADSRLILMNHL